MAIVRNKIFEAADGVRVQVSFTPGRNGKLVISEARSFDPIYVVIVHGDQFALVRRADHQVSALWRQLQPASVEENPLTSLQSLSTDQVDDILAGKINRLFKPRNTLGRPAVSVVDQTNTTGPNRPEPSLLPVVTKLKPKPPVVVPPGLTFRIKVSDFETEAPNDVATVTFLSERGKIEIQRKSVMGDDGVVRYQFEPSAIFKNSHGDSVQGQLTLLHSGAYKIEVGGKIYYFSPIDNNIVGKDYPDFTRVYGDPRPGELTCLYWSSKDTSGFPSDLTLLGFDPEISVTQRELREQAARILGLQLRERTLKPGLIFKGKLVARDRNATAQLSGTDHSFKIVYRWDGNSKSINAQITGPFGFAKDLSSVPNLSGNNILVTPTNQQGLVDIVSLRLNGTKITAQTLPVLSQESNSQSLKGVIHALVNNDSGATSLDCNAYNGPSSPKAFCTYANLGVATLAGMGVEWLFSGDEENGEHHTRAEVGFWRHVATALATGYTSTLFSNGRISIDQALESYGKGLLPGLPIDFVFNAAGFGSSPFGFAASFLANHFGDKIVEAVIGNNRLRSGLATTAGLALFLGSTAYSYYNETRQNKPNPLA